MGAGPGRRHPASANENDHRAANTFDIARHGWQEGTSFFCAFAGTESLPSPRANGLDTVSTGGRMREEAESFQKTLAFCREQVDQRVTTWIQKCSGSLDCRNREATLKLYRLYGTVGMGGSSDEIPGQSENYEVLPPVTSGSTIKSKFIVNPFALRVIARK